MMMTRYCNKNDTTQFVKKLIRPKMRRTVKKRIGIHVSCKMLRNMFRSTGVQVKIWCLKRFGKNIWKAFRIFFGASYAK